MVRRVKRGGGSGGELGDATSREWTEVEREIKGEENRG